MKYIPTFFALAALLASCESPPPTAYNNPGAPESMIKTSTEAVNVTLDTPSAIDDLVSWIDHDQPAQAELACAESEPACERARDVLEQFKVPFTRREPATPATVVLHYQHIVMRSCDNRYIDNPNNPYNLHYQSYGCSVATNMANQISDRQQLLHPASTGNMDAEHAATLYRGYENVDNTQQTINSQGGGSSSLLQNLGGGGGGSAR